MTKLNYFDLSAVSGWTIKYYFRLLLSSSAGWLSDTEADVGSDSDTDTDTDSDSDSKLA